MSTESIEGYGFDKNSHALGLALLGYNFTVLPGLKSTSSWSFGTVLLITFFFLESFVVHLYHSQSTWDGPELGECSVLFVALQVSVDFNLHH